MRIDVAVRALHPRQVFRIARARRGEVRNVFVRLKHDGVTGFGEASPNSFYGESAETVIEKIATAEPWLKSVQPKSVDEIAKAWDEVWRFVAPSRAAQCALDLAWWDWLAKSDGISVAGLAWGADAAPVPTFCTIGLSTAEELQNKIAELRGFPLIKIKSDGDADLEAVRSVRAASDARIAIDANGAWFGRDLDELAETMRELKIEFIEQPFPPEQDQMITPLVGGPPIFADESCVTESDVERIAERFNGFNIKLVKCGGLTPALRMARRGRSLGMKTMVGCMLESSVLIAAGAVVAQATDYADLDGAWLLGDDPFRGWRFERGTLSPSALPGLGVETSAAIFPERAR